MLDTLLNPYHLQILMFILINCILGISVYITLSTGQLTLGNAGFMSVGAYVSALLTLKFDLPIFLAVIVAGVAACIVASVIGIPTTRLQGLYLAIATIGFGEIVRVIILNMKVTNGALGLSGIPAIGISLTNTLSDFGINLYEMGLEPQTVGNVAVVLLLLAIVIALTFFYLRLHNSRVGRAFAAIKDDEHAAEVSGVDTVYYKLLAFFICAFLAGVAGALYAHVTFYIDPKDFSYHRAVEILLFAVFGGSNVIWGPLLGAVILTILPEALRVVADYRDMIYGIILVLMMIFRPHGILTEELVATIKKTIFGKGGKCGEGGDN
ncbi:MAG TPA: branched-chain amino acid ABC transporter permease [Candidatus Avacidaminococcus intestinavium]|uniref:Branched-chain amino acid ABC transporter permease n=1 Tax=Candidatus Avacidaminococcus intestinavium TaxID=2840684 RepID=A0A9D1MNP5_9FIRM|nr:branched-chain amino acid ABC transporter permease [Candidatus Avacidaminococcus intestinavium]